MNAKKTMNTKTLDCFTLKSSINWQGDLTRSAASFPDNRPGGQITGQITTTDLPADWTGYRSLQLTLHNPWPTTVMGSINIYDQAALVSPELEFGDFIGRQFMIVEGTTHLIIRVDPIHTDQGTRNLDLDSIAKVEIHIPDPQNDQPPISVSNLRLSEPEETLDDSAAAKPGDAVMLIIHLDVSCSVHQPDQYKEPADVIALENELRTEVTKLTDMVKTAEMNGKQTHYHEIPLVISDIALASRPMLAWHFSPRAKKKNMTQALAMVRNERQFLNDYLTGCIHEDDEDDSNLPIPYIKDFPDFSKIKIKDQTFIDKYNKPLLICAMNYHRQGRLMKFFATDQHRSELYAVGGGSRYDIEWSPVYDAFHDNKNTHRVGWRGWCGHLIKDQWAMGGMKENVIICLENKHILNAISQYNKQYHTREWGHLPDLIYAILAYELTYICYCDESLKRFRDWLKELHNDIETLNEKWNTTYTSFDQAVPPPATRSGPVPDANRAAWFDWATWNTRRFTDHLKWTKNDIRKLDADIPLCAGGTSSMVRPHNGSSGIDEEMIINEVDDVILHEGADLLTIDLFNALTEKPKPMVDPEHGRDHTRWLLNYLHGKSTLAKFWWPKQPSRQFPHMTLGAPMQGLMSLDDVAQQLRIAVDIRRLTEEITAFWNQPQNIAIVYSKTNMIQIPPALTSANTTPFLTALRQSYEAARCLDTPVTFISENQLAAGKADQYKLLILPALRHLPPDVFNAIDTYIKQGGNILMLPESLIADQYNRPADYLAQWGITIDSVEVPQIAGLGEFEQGYDQNFTKNVKFSEGKKLKASSMSISLESGPLQTTGLFQSITATNAETLAQGPTNQPMLIKKQIGSGNLYILAGTPEDHSLTSLLDHLYDQLKIDRPLKVTDPKGNRVPGLEARLVRQKYKDLVYLANETGRDVDFVIHTNRPFYKVRELRSLNYWQDAKGTIPKNQTYIFALMINPSRTNK